MTKNLIKHMKVLMGASSAYIKAYFFKALCSAVNSPLLTSGTISLAKKMHKPGKCIKSKAIYKSQLTLM